MEKRKLELEINRCEICPYMRFQQYYGPWCFNLSTKKNRVFVTGGTPPDNCPLPLITPANHHCEGCGKFTTTAYYLCDECRFA